MDIKKSGWVLGMVFLLGCQHGAENDTRETQTVQKIVDQPQKDEQERPKEGGGSHPIDGITYPISPKSICGISNLKFNDVFIVKDGEGKRFFMDLDSNYALPNDLPVVVTYETNATLGYILEIDGQKVQSGQNYTFQQVSYGSNAEIKCYKKENIVDDYTLVFTNLPLVALKSNKTIKDEPKVDGLFSFRSSEYGQYIRRQFMGIEIGGNTAKWFPKKTYHVELRKDNACKDGKKKRLLDMRKDDDWILDAAYRDATFVRNIVAQDLFNAMRHYAYKRDGKKKGQAAIHGHPAEVALNEDYAGAYVVEERVDRKLLDLKKIKVQEDGCRDKWEEVDFTDPKNGSLLYKAANRFANFNSVLSASTAFEQKYPKSEDVKRWKPLEALLRFVSQSSDESFRKSVADKFDMDNVVDWWCLVLASKGIDNITTNYYLARSEEGRFFFVPWDFDATWGMNWAGAKDAEADTWFGEGNYLIDRLLADPSIGFVDKVKKRWLELRSNIFSEVALKERFKNYFDEIDAAKARERTFERWPLSGGVGSFERMELGSMTYISNWIDSRMAYVDNKIDQLPNADNLIPRADAGSDQRVEVNTLVSLNADQSADPDGQIVSYHWKQIEGEAVTLIDADKSQASFTAPGSKQVLVFELEVTDNKGATALSQIKVAVGYP